MNIGRREFLKLAGIGGMVFVSGAGGPHRSAAAATGAKNLFFIQVSDTHWGFSNPAVNPDFSGTLKKVVSAVNRLAARPDFIVFTGDLTHVTDDDNERRKRLSQFRDIAGALKVKDVRFMPGEHDAGLDEAEAYKEILGETYYAFDHKGTHFIALDNVSDPKSTIGEKQMDWLRNDLKPRDKDNPIVVFTHRPLFDLYTDWDWYTRDGAQVIDILMPYSNVTVFYGHIHQEHYTMTGHIQHHACKGTMYPLPAPGSVPVKSPVQWDAARPYKGLGFREVNVKARARQVDISEFTVEGKRA